MTTSEAIAPQLSNGSSETTAPARGAEAKPTPEPQFLPSVFPYGSDERDELLNAQQREFLKIVQSIAPNLRGLPVLVVQDNRCPLGVMCEHLYLNLRDDIKRNVPQGTPITIILHSFGGYAGEAYRLARCLNRHCGSYDVLIPSQAKSAATLFALGADRIIMGDDAELGPLDAQVPDAEREQNISALEVVQSVERLSNEAVQAVDAHMVHWVRRSRKKVDTLLPVATKFVAELMRPLFEKLDSVQFTGMSRVLKVAEDYAERLLRERYGDEAAFDIAAALTLAYSEHDFAIDFDEARSIRLKVHRPDDSVRSSVEELAGLLDNLWCGTMIGRVLEDRNEEQPNQASSTDKQGTSRSACRASIARCSC